MRRYFTFIFLLVSVPLLWAQTNISGTISGQTWDSAGSPYHIQGDVTIESLIIKPGVTVLFDDNYEFKVTGLLKAWGFYSDSIYFKPAGTNPNHWGGILFSAANPQSIIAYCHIEGSGQPGVRIENSSGTLHISNCTMVNNVGDGVNLKNSTARLVNSIIRNNGKNGVYLDHSQLTLINSLCVRNTEAGIFSIDDTDTIAVQNSVLADNSGSGIISLSGKISVLNSIIYDNYPQEISSRTENTTVNYTDIRGGWSGEGSHNLNVDPLFADSAIYTLQAVSSCIDAGKEQDPYNDLYFPPSLGSQRNDMGAYGGPMAGRWFPPLYIQPNSVDFGKVTQDSSISLDFTARNYRDSVVSVSRIFFHGAKTQVFRVNKDSMEIGVLDSAHFTVTFTPDHQDVFQADLILSSTSYGTSTAFLKGEGVVSEINILDTYLDFHTVHLGDSSTLNIRILNAGGDTLRIYRMFATNPVFKLSTSRLKIAPNLTLDTLQVTFIPDSAGTYSDSLIILNNDPDEQHSAIPLSGHGAGAVIGLNNDLLDFGSVKVHRDSSRRLTISNLGNEILNLTNILIAGNDSTPVPFHLTDSALKFPIPIQPGQKYDLSVSFSPLNFGPSSARMYILSNDSIRAQKTISLTGTGLSPLLQTSPTQLDFGSIPFMTDSVRKCTISNHGNISLEIDTLKIIDNRNHAFDLMLDDLPLPTGVDPDSSAELSVRFKAVSVGRDSARLIIVSHLFSDSIRLKGQSLPATLTLHPQTVDFGRVPKDSTRKQTLYISNTGQGTLILFADSLSVQGADQSDFSFEKPSSDVMIDVGDSMALSLYFVPGQTGPKEASLRLACNDPQNPKTDIPLYGIAFDAQPIQVTYNASHSSKEFIRGESAKLSFDLSQKSTIDSVLLYFRQGGQAAFSKFLLSRQGASNIWSVSIPASNITERGFQYYLNIFHGWALTVWPEGGGSNPQNVQTLVPELSFPQLTRQKTYQMISLPVLTGGQTLDALFSDNLGIYDSTQYRIFDVKNGSAYTEIKNLGIPLPPGKALWLITRDTTRLDVVNGQSVPTDQNFSLNLKQGWNMIGDPFAFPLSWAQIDNRHTLRFYDGTDWPFASVLEPYKGYALYVDQDTTLRISPREMQESSTFSAKAVTGRENDWQIQLSVSSGARKDRFNYAGVREQATAFIDRYDEPEPPPIGQYVSLYLLPDQAEEVYPHRFSTDFRSPDEDGYRFTFEIASNMNGFKTIRLTPFHLPPNYNWSVVSPQTNIDYGRSVIKTGSKHMKFELLVGSEDFLKNMKSNYAAIPTRFDLKQNYPNPFGASMERLRGNRNTCIRYQLPHFSAVSIDVFNILGQHVKSLFHSRPQEAGYYQIDWDGTNSTGRKVSAGIYFLRFHADHFTKTIKMILQK